MSAFAFGPFCLDTTAYRLTRDGAVVDASPRQLDLLAYFASRPSQLVTRDELFKALWPDVTVSDNALTQLVSELRHTLGDPSVSPRYVQTVARRGYRFVAPVVPADTRHASIEASTAHQRRSHETADLDALRAATEGRLKLEALDPEEVETAIESFDRAIALDAAFAAAYVGRANARFWKYEQTKYGYRPEATLLASAINDARHGIALAPDYAEAHATLSYLLTATGRSDESRAAARTAITLEPQQWRHHFRLGHASWGQARLDALHRCVQLYPSFPFAHFQMAMVYVARDDLDTAALVINDGIAVLDTVGAARSRFPASGLHWLAGSIRLVRDDVDGALSDFSGELNSQAPALYAAEFSVAALNSRGFALARAGRVEEAETAFRQALAANPEQARAPPGLAGLAIAGQRRPEADSAATHLERARDAITKLRRGGRVVEADLMTAGAAAVEAQTEDAVAALGRVLKQATSGTAGWSIPIDPLLEGIRSAPAFGQILHQLAQRAQ